MAPPTRNHNEPKRNIISRGTKNPGHIATTKLESQASQFALRGSHDSPKNHHRAWPSNPRLGISRINLKSHHRIWVCKTCLGIQRIIANPYWPRFWSSPQKPSLSQEWNPCLSILRINRNRSTTHHDHGWNHQHEETMHLEALRISKGTKLSSTSLHPRWRRHTRHGTLLGEITPNPSIPAPPSCDGFSIPASINNIQQH